MPKINITSGTVLYVNNDVILETLRAEGVNHILYRAYEVNFRDAKRSVGARFDWWTVGDGTSMRVNISEYLRVFCTPLPPSENYKEVLRYALSRVDMRITQFVMDKSHFTDVYIYVIRGGVRTNESNVEPKRNSCLTPISEEIPFWEGYPFALYYLGSGGIEKVPYAVIKNDVGRGFLSELLEPMPVKGGGGAYIKFYNSRGGYSYWLFENYTQTTSVPSGRYSNHLGEVRDFGRETQEILTVKSRVKARYMELMRDLADSPKVLLYDKERGVWRDLVSTGNKTETGIYKPYTDVSLSFEVIDNYRNN